MFTATLAGVLQEAARATAPPASTAAASQQTGKRGTSWEHKLIHAYSHYSCTLQTACWYFECVCVVAYRSMRKLFWAWCFLKWTFNNVTLLVFKNCNWYRDTFHGQFTCKNEQINCWPTNYKSVTSIFHFTYQVQGAQAWEFRKHWNIPLYAGSSSTIHLICWAVNLVLLTLWNIGRSHSSFMLKLTL